MDQAENLPTPYRKAYLTDILTTELNAYSFRCSRNKRFPNSLSYNAKSVQSVDLRSVAFVLSVTLMGRFCSEKVFR